MNSLLGGKLVFLKKNGINRCFYTTRGGIVSFGKNPACQFRLKSADALGVHCKIVAGKFGKIKIVNCSEGHPVCVNGETVRKKRVLLSGDTIEILGIKFQWKFDPPAVSLESHSVDNLSAGPSFLRQEKRMCQSEPGRKQKLIRMNQNVAVSVLIPFQNGRKTMFTHVVDTQPVTSEKSPVKETTVVTDVSKSIYETPMEVTVTPERVTNATIDLIDLNTPAQVFKTPYKHTISSKKTPSVGAKADTCPPSVDFKGLAQSTPIDGGKIRSLKMEPFTKNSSTIIEVEGSTTVISIEDSDPSTPEIVTPQRRLLRSASKVDSSFTTPKSSTRISKRAATSARKPPARVSKMNVSDTTGEKTRPTVSQLHHLMTMENLADISTSKVEEKENSDMKTPSRSTRLSSRINSSTKKPNLSLVKSGKVEKLRSPLNNLNNLLTSPKTPSVTTVARSQVILKSPENNLTNISGVRRLFKTPGKDKGGLEDFHGVRNLLKTPKINDTTVDLKGIREMLKEDNPAQDASLRLAGIRELLKSPSSNNDETIDLKGIRELLKDIPEEEASMRLTGLRELLKSPSNDKTVDLRGIRELLKDIPDDKEASMRLAGIRDLLKSPTKDDESVNLQGVRDIFREIPEDQESMRLSGIKNLLKSPPQPEKSVNYVGVKELLAEVEEEPTAHFSGVQDLFVQEKTVEIDLESSSSSSESVAQVIELSPSVDEIFDSLAGRQSMPSVTRTYSRKDSPTKKKKEEMERDAEKERGIHQWIDSLVSTPADGIQARRANNTQQVLSDKYSNVTPSGSKTADSMDVARDPEEIMDVDNESGGMKTPLRATTAAAKGRVASLRQKAITQSSNRSLNLLNDSFDNLFHSTPLVENSPPRRTPRRAKVKALEELTKTPSTAERSKRGRPAKSLAEGATSSSIQDPKETVKEPPAPRRGGRKKTVQTDAEDTSVAVKRPRRGRVASEKNDEIPKETLEVPVELPSRRGRKKVAQSDAESTPGVVERPRRGRVASEKVNPVEEKPRRRGGRKKTVQNDIEDTPAAPEKETADNTSAIVQDKEKKSRRGRVTKSKKNDSADQEEEAKTTEQDSLASRRGRRAAATKADTEEKKEEEEQKKPSRRGRKKTEVKSSVDASPEEVEGKETPRRARKKVVNFSDDVFVNTPPAGAATQKKRGRPAKQPAVVSVSSSSDGADNVAASDESTRPRRNLRSRKA